MTKKTTIRNLAKQMKRTAKERERGKIAKTKQRYPQQIHI